MEFDMNLESFGTMLGEVQNFKLRAKNLPFEQRKKQATELIMKMMKDFGDFEKFGDGDDDAL